MFWKTTGGNPETPEERDRDIIDRQEKQLKAYKEKMEQAYFVIEDLEDIILNSNIEEKYLEEINECLEKIRDYL